MRRLLLSLVLPLAVVGCGTARRDVPVAGPMNIADPQVAQGERVFMRMCSPCHPRGEAGLGPAINNKPLPDFLIKFQVRHGLGAMPAFGKKTLSEPDLRAIVAYLDHMKKREPRRGTTG